MSFVAQSKTDHIHTSLSQSEKDELYFKILISMIQSNPATWGVGGGGTRNNFGWESATGTLKPLL